MAVAVTAAAAVSAAVATKAATCGFEKVQQVKNYRCRRHLYRVVAIINSVFFSPCQRAGRYKRVKCLWRFHRMKFPQRGPLLIFGPGPTACNLGAGASASDSVSPPLLILRCISTFLARSFLPSPILCGVHCPPLLLLQLP